ncbi:hypothetical protein K1719_032255 [Acacia pycnantha]|nr:hypothetical protein K1719_046282 [Acacia pycnantha]KAI9085841.1 hypothetical protein K1719_032255 [Acacia pycnantha]
MARLQELQCTVAGGTKVVSGVNLSPRSTRGYLRTSLRWVLPMFHLLKDSKSSFLRFSSMMSQLAAWIEEVNKIGAYTQTRNDPKEIVYIFKKQFLAQQ